MRTSLLIIHILAAGTWIGANVTQLVANRRMAADGGPTAAAWFRTVNQMGRVLYSPAAGIILITGIWLVIDSPVYDWENIFVVIGFLMVAIGAGLGITFFGPLSEQIAQTHETGKDMALLPRMTTRLSAVGAFDTLLLIVTVAAMTGKWGV